MNWLLSDWRSFLPAPWANIVLIFVAILCGSIVEATLTYCPGHRNHREFLGHLIELPEIKEVRREN